MKQSDGGIDPVYDLQLHDHELFERYYDVKGKEQTRKEIQRFVSQENANTLMEHLFSFPDFKLGGYLKEYCSRAFEDVKELTLEKILDLRANLSARKKLSSPSSPFWNPISTANEETLIIASVPNQSGDRVRKLVDEMFAGRPIKTVGSENLQEVMLVQISHGLKLEEIFPLEEESIVEKYSDHFGLDKDEL